MIWGSGFRIEGGCQFSVNGSQSVICEHLRNLRMKQQLLVLSWQFPENGFLPSIRSRGDLAQE